MNVNPNNAIKKSSIKEENESLSKVKEIISFKFSQIIFNKKLNQNENPINMLNKAKLVDTDSKSNTDTLNAKGNNKSNLTNNELMQLSIKKRREFLTKYDVEESDSCDSDWSD